MGLDGDTGQLLLSFPFEAEVAGAHFGSLCGLRSASETFGVPISSLNPVGKQVLWGEQLEFVSWLLESLLFPLCCSVSPANTVTVDL